MTNDIKTFTISLKADNPEVKSEISSIKVYIISDDVEKVTMAGHYTLTVQSFFDDSQFSSLPGGVEIIQDLDDSNRYYMKNMVLVAGDNVLPLTLAGDLYFIVGNDGSISLPSQQKIGDYGAGEGFTIGLTSEGDPITDPVKIEKSGDRLLFKVDGFAAAFIDDNDEMGLYYALKNIILEKVNH